VIVLPGFSPLPLYTVAAFFFQEIAIHYFSEHSPAIAKQMPLFPK
jgi:hypothetical protein